MQNEKSMDINHLNPDATLDAKGLGCPLPLLKAKQAMEKLKPGQVLELVGDDPVSINDIPGWCKFTGHTFLGIKEEGAFFKMYIKKA